MASKVSKEDALALTTATPVFVYSGSYCPHCTNAKNLLKQKKLKAGTLVILEFDKDKNGDALGDFLEKETGKSSVPQIWIGGKFIGGNSDLQQLEKDGKLDGLLQDAGAL